MKNNVVKSDKKASLKNSKTGINNQKLKVVRIPLDKINPTDLYVPVQINGEKIICKRGEDIYLPVPFVKLLKDSGYLD